jgi:DNA-binding response OmpR family regulator
LPGLAEVNIIAATGYGQEADRHRGLDAGFDHYLVKPIALDTLLEALAAGGGTR